MASMTKTPPLARVLVDGVVTAVDGGGLLLAAAARCLSANVLPFLTDDDPIAWIMCFACRSSRPTTRS